MPFLAHLNELRSRMLRVAIVVVLFVILALLFYRQILDVFTAPVNTLISAGGGELSALRLTEPWTVAARISILVGLSFGWPVFVFEISRFLIPGLKPNERVYVWITAPLATLLFAAGAAFAYFVLTPFLFRFLIRFGNNISGLSLSPSLESTIGLLVNLMFSMGIVFQLPLVMFALAKIGLVKHAQFARSRRWAVVLAFFAGAALTPTVDPLTQLLVALPIIVLFELGIVLIRITTRAPQRASDTNEVKAQ